MTDPFAEIKRRHSDIPQDTLPLDFDDLRRTGERPKRKTAKAVRFATCPDCRATKPIGVVLGVDGAEVFCEHAKVLASRRRIRCSGSGTPAPIDEGGR